MNDKRDLQVGQTMFEFLKRKKRLALENTLKTSRQITQRNNMSPVPASDFSKTQRDAPSTLTPDSTSRNQLEDARPATRSFMQMISPIRSKSPVPDSKSPAKDKVKIKNDNYSRRALLQKAGEMREAMQSALRIGRQLNEKFKALGVEVTSLIKSSSGQQGQTARAILRGCQNGLRQLGTPGRQQALDAFFSSLWQQLDQFQGDTRLQVEDVRKTLTQELIQKQLKIKQLEQNALTLDRQIVALNRRNQKVESTHEQIRQNVVKQYEEYKKEVAGRIIQLEDKISTLEKQVFIKEDEKRSVIEDVSRLQGELKKAKFDREKYQQECLNTITRVKSEQQQFLLNEIMLVKTQCATDMAELATLHRQKEENLQVRLLEANTATQKMKSHLEDLLQAHQRTEQSIIALKAQNTRIKKQNECLATDMHRINQELYQHWLALKDVKTLSLRLDSFHQFRKIYEDLGFNEQLFL